MSIPVTVIGNATDDPKLSFTQSGVAFTGFSVAVNQRFLNKDTNTWEDGKTTFVRCIAWRQLAENIAGTVSKGMRVIVSGKMEQNDFTTKEGEKRTGYQVVADDIGVSIKNATAKVERNVRSEQSGNFTTSNDGWNTPEADPWATQIDTPPF